MKIKYLVSSAGPGAAVKPGEVREVDADEGKRLCESGQAVPVAEKRVRKATIKATEDR